MLSFKVLSLGTLLVSVSMGVPFFFYHFLKGVFNFPSKRKLVSISSKDSNVYGRGLLSRLFYRWPKLPKVIVPKVLEEQLGRMVKKDRTITKHNKNNKIKKKYTHCLIYGVTGVGKTLFCKKYAQWTDMNFIYFSIVDLFKVSEKKVLQDFKRNHTKL